MDFVQIVLTSIAVWVILNILSRKRKSVRQLKYTQSGIHELIKDFLPANITKKTKNINSQSRKHIEKNMLRVVMVEGKAYWVVDNVFYMSDIVDGNPDTNTAKPVDTDNMSKQEVEKMLLILDSLKRGRNNDSGSSSN